MSRLDSNHKTSNLTLRGDSNKALNKRDCSHTKCIPQMTAKPTRYRIVSPRLPQVLLKLLTRYSVSEQQQSIHQAEAIFDETYIRSCC